MHFRLDGISQTKYVGEYNEELQKTLDFCFDNNLVLNYYLGFLSFLDAL